jgi:hypothetical protein
MRRSGLLVDACTNSRTFEEMRKWIGSKQIQFKYVARKYFFRIFRPRVAVQTRPVVETSGNAKEGTTENTPMDPSGPYRADTPLDNEEHDLFDRAPFANRIADTIGTRTDPSSLVVAVYGPWGDGKTTVLNFIRNRLRSYPSAITVNFNPWRMDGEKALLQGFFETLADALNRELTTKSEMAG